MALQLWMPLMGDLRNQGLSNYSISSLGTISWVDGKLGAKAMKAGNDTQTVNGVRIEDTFVDLLNGNHSVSVWVKPYGNHVHYNGSIFSSGNWNTAKKRWAFGVSQDNTKVDVLCSDYNTYINCTVPVNQWTHLVCTCDSGRIVRLYKNGEFIGTVDRHASNAFDSDSTFTCIGRESYANGYFSFNGAIQDFRLYDHCLSPMEVKQLSQGLVLHYPLNRQGWGQENLVRNSNQFKTGGHASGVTPSVEADGTYKVIAESGNSNYSSSWWWEMTGIEDSFVEDEPFTVSFWIKSSNANKTKPPTIYLKNGMGYYSMQGSVSANYSQVYYTGTWKKTNSLAPHLGWSGLVGTYYICHWKIEKGSIPTTWCPNSSDTLATTMGLNGTTEYDCSGYCNNLNKHGTYSYSSDTPKYMVSTEFSGTEWMNGATPGAEIMTLACWAKTSKNKSTSQFMVADSTSAMAIAFYSGCIIGVFGTTRSTGSKSTLGSSYKENDWNHFVVVKTGDAGERAIYCNGVLLTPTSNDYWSAAAGLFIGSRNGSGGLPFYGQICDVRAYATALSATDVKSLYQNCATIDPDGTIRGQIRS